MTSFRSSILVWSQPVSFPQHLILQATPAPVRKVTFSSTFREPEFSRCFTFLSPNNSSTVKEALIQITRVHRPVHHRFSVTVDSPAAFRSRWRSHLPEPCAPPAHGPEGQGNDRTHREADDRQHGSTLRLLTQSRRSRLGAAQEIPSQDSRPMTPRPVAEYVKTLKNKSIQG